jgi:dipeptidyl aminopeptidase/acylaminoacyl peptidase
MKFNLKSVLLTSSIAFFLVFSLHAKEKDDQAKSEWKIEDVINQESAGGFQMSPDGNWAVWVKSIPDKKKDSRISHVFLTSLKEKGDTIQLTRGDERESSPKWSPSGKFISFLSTRKVKEEKSESSGSQLWLMDLRGGEPWKISSLQFGVMGYEWMDDNRLLILARENRTLLEQQKKEKKDSSYVAEDQEHMTPRRLFLFDRNTKKINRLTENKDQITTFALSHNKKWVLTRNNQSVRYRVDAKIKPKYFLVNLDDKSSQELFPDPTFKPRFFRWTLDDKGFYFSIHRTSDYVHDGPGADFLYYFDLETKKYEEVPLDWEWGLFYFGLQVRKDGFIASLANGTRPKWRRYYKKGNTYTYKELEGNHYPNIYGLVLHKKGNVVLYNYSTASKPAQWFLASLEGNVLQTKMKITELNAHLKNKTMAKTEVIKWIGALDEEIEGVLYYPHNYKKGKRYPLILMIHGGPTGVDMDAFRESTSAYPNIMAQKGAFVLRANYHGSGGYGQKFAESIKGHYYEYEIPDMLKGIDHLVEKGMVDPEQLGTMGWSNGGILTVGLTVWTDRFKVAGVGAADINWISDYGNCAFGVSFDNYYFKGAPWDELEHYIKKSPFFHLKEMKVPTIIFHGTEDTNVPYEQGWEYYRALQQIGKAPVRFIVFPGQPHGLRKLTHQHRKMKEEINWFDKHFFKTLKKENDAFKKGSPLDIAFKKEKFEKAGPLYGKKFKGFLIPELVKTKEGDVGRFEVTRAQWAAFDKKYKYEPGTGNFPVSSIPFEKATKYVEWLTKITGKEYRLPKVSEAAKLAKKGRKDDNTLDYWAGYSLNPDDAKLLLQKIKILKKFAPLLLSVDSRPASGEETIYGLGGNVAEWAVNENGKGKIAGCSAITPIDPSGSYTPSLDYVGLRVIRDKS